MTPRRCGSPRGPGGGDRRPPGALHPIGHRTLDATANLPLRTVIECLGPVFADTSLEILGHDMKFCAMVCQRHGLPLAGPVFDAMLASYLLDSTRAPHSIEDLGMTYLGYRLLAPTKCSARARRRRPSRRYPRRPCWTSCANVPTWRGSWPMCCGGSRGQGLDALYRDMELPLVPVLMAIEQAGIRVDVRALATLSHHLEHEMAA